jgi:hypothetical protein
MHEGQTAHHDPKDFILSRICLPAIRRNTVLALTLKYCNTSGMDLGRSLWLNLGTNFELVTVESVASPSLRKGQLVYNIDRKIQ